MIRVGQHLYDADCNTLIIKAVEGNMVVAVRVKRRTPKRRTARSRVAKAQRTRQASKHRL
jgi:hypothetical protein